MKSAASDSGLAGTTATGRTEGAEAGVAPGKSQDARPGDPSKVGEARFARPWRFRFPLRWFFYCASLHHTPDASVVRRSEVACHSVLVLAALASSQRVEVEALRWAEAEPLDLDWTWCAGIITWTWAEQPIRFWTPTWEPSHV